MCRPRRGHGGAASLSAEGESCDAVVIDLRDSCLHEETGFGDGANVVCTCWNIGRLFDLGLARDLDPLLLFKRSLFCLREILEQVWCRC